MSKLDLTKPVQTRDGRKVRIICTDRVSDNYPLLALIPDPDGKEYSQSYTLDGKLYADTGSSDNLLDLVNVPPRTSRFFNVYDTGDIYQHNTLAAAKVHADFLANATIECIFEDKKLVEVIHRG